MSEAASGRATGAGQAPSAAVERQHALPGVFARGLAMGVAEAVPGVSGGTIAFITGIYDALVRAIGSFAAVSPRTLLAGGWRGVAQRHQLPFLAALAAGMVVSFLAVARVIEHLLEARGPALYGFFFGLIAASVVLVGRSAVAEGDGRWAPGVMAGLAVAGLAVGLAVALFSEPATPEDVVAMPLLFLAGAVAAVAWILPGVSGAFVLVLFGLYAPMVAAVNAGDLPLLAVFGAGLGLGVVAFSRVLAWLLARVRGPLLAFLTGLMAGSLVLLWRRTGVADWSDPALAGVLAAAGAGVAVVVALVWAARRRGAALADQPAGPEGV